MTAGSKKQQSSGLRLRVRQAIRFIIRQVKTEAGSALKPQIIKPQATLRQAKKKVKLIISLLRHIDQ